MACNMEPDYDKILSNKIRETEQQPILWNKQGVWQKLQPEKTQGWHYNALYYTSAAVVLLLMYVVAIRPIHNEIDLSAGDAKIREEERSVQPITSAPLEKNGNHSPNPAVDKPNDIVAGSLTELGDNGLKNSGSAQHQRRPVDPTIEPVLADRNIQEELPLQEEVSSQEKVSLQEEVHLPEEVTTKEQKIRPIVGVIVESDLTLVAKTKRKKSLRKLESSGTVPWEDPESPLVFMVRK